MTFISPKKRRITAWMHKQEKKGHTSYEVRLLLPFLELYPVVICGFAGSFYGKRRQCRQAFLPGDKISWKMEAFHRGDKCIL